MRHESQPNFFDIERAFAGTMLGRSYYSPTTCPLGVERVGDARGRLGAYEDLGIALIGDQAYRTCISENHDTCPIHA